MKFEQYYLECLSQASYLIADTDSGVAAVVDPRRDIQTYLDDAAADGLEIRYVIETHFHADFLSGHLELAEATGAEIVYGAAAQAEYPIRRVTTGERIALGDPDTGVVLEFRETPGHTPESISVVVWERGTDEQPFGVLTGDTLFIGDVGRPDLLGPEMTEPLAHAQWSSMRRLRDEVSHTADLYPTHGFGSFCSATATVGTASTLAQQIASNPAFHVDEDTFVTELIAGLDAFPRYYPRWCRPLVRVPGLREVATWNLALVLERR